MPFAVSCAGDVSVDLPDGWSQGIADALMGEPEGAVEFIARQRPRHLAKHLRNQTQTWEDVIVKNVEFKKLSAPARISFEAELWELFPDVGGVGGLGGAAAPVEVKVDISSQIAPIVGQVAKALDKVKGQKEEKRKKEGLQEIINEHEWQAFKEHYPSEVSCAAWANRPIVHLIHSIDSLRGKHSPPLTDLKEEILCMQKSLQATLQERVTPGRAAEQQWRSDAKRALNITLPQARTPFRNPPRFISKPFPEFSPRVGWRIQRRIWGG